MISIQRIDDAINALERIAGALESLAEKTDRVTAIDYTPRAGEAAAPADNERG